MPRIIVREPRGKRDKTPTEYYVPDESRDFHTEFGSISKDTLKKGGLITVGNERMRIYPATFADRYARLRRGVQIVTTKDVGMILAETGIDRDSVVLDIGFGSGAVSAYLARIAKKVYAYDVSQENIDHGLRNLEELETPKNYTVKQGDAYDEKTISEEGVIDVFVLDVPEPWRALATARKALKQGGWFVAYTPCITQANQLADALRDDWQLVKCCELIEREWKVQGQAVRPVTKDFSHTAFLTFIRKVS
jgi:tRNA (adenine57-N1/adenine58-N1)-methyltransferase catalytic subunit